MDVRFTFTKTRQIIRYKDKNDKISAKQGTPAQFGPEMTLTLNLMTKISRVHPLMWTIFVKF